MTEPRTDASSVAGIGAASASSAIRRQAVWSAIAAGLLLYFGKSVDWELVSTGGAVIGPLIMFSGYLMIASTVLLLSGVPFALAFDGVASMLIGLVLAISGGVLLMQGIAAQGMINMVVGFVFASSGWNNLGMFRTIRQMRAELASVTEAAQAAGSPMGAGATGIPREAAGRQDAPGSAQPEASDPTPDGYLASFADRGPDDEDRDR